MSDPVRNQIEVVICAFQRSGHHAIMQWLLPRLNPPVCLLHDVVPYSDPFFSYVDGRQFMEQHRDMLMPLDDIEALRRTSRNCLMIDYQDTPLDDLTNPNIIPNRTTNLGHSDKRFHVLIIRDPFNLAASRLTRTRYVQEQVANGNPDWRLRLRINTRGTADMYPGKRFFHLWLEYAKEYLGQTNRLAACRGSTTIKIAYNHWFTDPSSRAKICADMGVVNDDRNLERVSAGGKGSSFDGLEFDGRAADMEVLGRWRKLLGDEEFRGMFKGQVEVYELSKAIFGEIPGTAELIG